MAGFGDNGIDNPDVSFGLGLVGTAKRREENAWMIPLFQGTAKDSCLVFQSILRCQIRDPYNALAQSL